MNITISQVEEVLGTFAQFVEIHIGRESDGDRVIACVMPEFDAELAALCNRAVVKFNNQSPGRDYVPVTLSERWFARYRVLNGFTEAEDAKVEAPFPIEFRWEEDYVVIYVNGTALPYDAVVNSRISHKAAAAFCRDNLQESVNQRQSQ